MSGLPGLLAPHPGRHHKNVPRPDVSDGRIAEPPGLATMPGDTRPGHPDRRRLENQRLMHNPGTGESFFPYPGQPEPRAEHFGSDPQQWDEGDDERQPSLLARIAFALRCLWRARLRKHDHCWDCGNCNFNGTFRCDACRGREPERRSSWWLRCWDWLAGWFARATEDDDLELDLRDCCESCDDDGHCPECHYGPGPEPAHPDRYRWRPDDVPGREPDAGADGAEGGTLPAGHPDDTLGRMAAAYVPPWPDPPPPKVIQATMVQGAWLPLTAEPGWQPRTGVARNTRASIWRPPGQARAPWLTALLALADAPVVDGCVQMVSVAA